MSLTGQSKRASALREGDAFVDGNDALVVQRLSDAPSGWVRLHCIYRNNICINTTRVLPVHAEVQVLS